MHQTYWLCSEPDSVRMVEGSGIWSNATRKFENCTGYGITSCVGHAYRRHCYAATQGDTWSCLQVDLSYSMAIRHRRGCQGWMFSMRNVKTNYFAVQRHFLLYQVQIVNQSRLYQNVHGMGGLAWSSGWMSDRNGSRQLSLLAFFSPKGRPSIISPV